ncbi:hypothetical protein RQP54_18550 [Curvibacter sp. APW13]|uniref:hypothetical protein n=1 Tax=Curvibacter sp. APW13 TaxID=3077236 RepID=UPI0028DDDCFC|nr:hypothetical protein [Curvibacter sp. APW13]MDT8992881.1 hypothetical protein [Curvibacter sp. APW13]
MARTDASLNLAFDFGDVAAAPSVDPKGNKTPKNDGRMSRQDRAGRHTVASGVQECRGNAGEVASSDPCVVKGRTEFPEGQFANFSGINHSSIGDAKGLAGSDLVLSDDYGVAKDAEEVFAGQVQGLSGIEGVAKNPSKGECGDLKVRSKDRAGRNEVYEINPNVVLGETLFDIDPPKRRNAGYRVRRDLLQERQVDMPLFITGVEIRAGIAEDDRHWNRKFNELRDQITKEVGDLRFVIGDRMSVEVTWNLPLNWPYVALRAPDGRRIVDTDSAELGSYGLRSVTMLWKGIVEKQRAMQAMARNYAAMLRWAEKLRTKVPVAMDGSRTCKLLLDPEIHKQINALEWPTYLRDTSGGPFSPLPFNVYESMRVRLWAYVKAVKQHVHAMNLNYNRVTNEKRASLGKTRGAALAVAIMDGPARTPQHYWALWVRKGSENLFYKVVTPRFFSLERGKYITSESFAVSDERGRLSTYAVDRCHLTHMKDLYRAADHVLADLLVLSKKTADLVVETMGKRHGKESSAASGRGSWRGSGVLFRWIPGQ